MESLLIIRLSSLGDIIHTLPALSILRQNFPGAKIYWATQKAGKEILDLVSGIDETIVLQKNLLGKSLKIRNKKIEVALDFQGLLKSAFLAFLSGAKRRIGFNRQNLKEPLARLFYTETPSALNEFDHHVIYKNLKLLELVGLKTEWTPAFLNFPLVVPEEIKERVKTKLAEAGVDPSRPILLFNVGASWESKRLPAAFWIEVIKATEKELNQDFQFCLLWGNEEELNLAHKIHLQTKILILPFLDIKEVMALISLTFLLVSGDTFALQVASALNIPVVGLFGPTSPIRNGPFHSHDAIIYGSVDCSPCYRRRCSRPRCWEAISPRQVSSAIISRLKHHG